MAGGTKGCAARRGGSMTVAPKSGCGSSRWRMAASIGEPQLWQKAFSSRTAAPHFGQVTMNFHPSPCNSKRTRAPCDPAGILELRGV
jgi:hypothetical protein